MTKLSTYVNKKSDQLSKISQLITLISSTHYPTPVTPHKTSALKFSSIENPSVDQNKLSKMDPQTSRRFHIRRINFKQYKNTAQNKQDSLAL